MAYKRILDPDLQISTEESIASLIFERTEDIAHLSEDACAQLGRDILLLVLKRFRPDLLE